MTDARQTLTLLQLPLPLLENIGCFLPRPGALFKTCSKWAAIAKTEHLALEWLWNTSAYKKWDPSDEDSPPYPCSIVTSSCLETLFRRLENMFSLLQNAVDQAVGAENEDTQWKWARFYNRYFDRGTLVWHACAIESVAAFKFLWTKCPTLVKHYSYKSYYAALREAIKRAKIDIFDIILGPDSLRPLLAQHHSPAYNELARQKLDPEPYAWMTLSAVTLTYDQYPVLEHFMRIGKVESSIFVIFRLLGRATENPSLNCVRGLMNIVSARDDWLFETHDGHLRYHYDNELSDNFEEDPNVDPLQRATVGIPYPDDPFEVIFRSRKKVPPPAHIGAALIDALFSERRIRLKFWNDRIPRGLWALFRCWWGPYVLETVPSASHAAMMVCSTLFKVFDTEDRHYAEPELQYGELWHEASQCFVDIADTPELLRLIEYLNDHATVRALLLQQCRVMKRDYTARVLPAVYYGTSWSIAHTLKLPRYTYPGGERIVSERVRRMAERSLDLLLHHGVIDDEGAE